MIDVGEIVHDIGTLAGIGSALFLFYDRGIRHRPVLALHRESVGSTAHARFTTPR
jgi:hypothetical protein